jgi:hypothetical protein
MMHGPTTIEDAAAVLEHVGRDEERQPGDEFSETVLSSWINGADRQHEFAIARGSLSAASPPRYAVSSRARGNISVGHTAPRGVPSPCGEHDRQLGGDSPLSSLVSVAKLVDVERGRVSYADFIDITLLPRG